MPSHEWRLSLATAPDTAVAHGSAGDQDATHQQAFDAAEEFLRAGNIEPIVVLIGGVPVAHLAPARGVDGGANIAESLAVLAGIRGDLQGDDR